VNVLLTLSGAVRSKFVGKDELTAKQGAAAVVALAEDLEVVVGSAGDDHHVLL